MFICDVQKQSLMDVGAYWVDRAWVQAQHPLRTGAGRLWLGILVIMPGQMYVQWNRKVLEQERSSASEFSPHF